ncbi:MAG: dephospho-CoA kinase [Verrucomicrobiota bacterium]|jgi:dephospho-CoA kinase
MKLFGITGGIAMGKSTAGRLLRQQGVAVIDTDESARQVVEPGQPALAEIRERFGPAVFLPDGRLDRDELARQVFALPAARADLEAILHPRIRALWQAEADTWRKCGRPCGAVVIPLLFETRAEEQLDATICVACSAAEQARRMSARGWDAVQSRQRMEAQWPVEKKIAHSDFVVWTDTPLEMHAAQLLKIMGRWPRG